MKLLYVLVVFACSIQLGLAGPFAKDTIAVYATASENCYIYEYTIAGTKIQEILLSAGLSCLTGSPMITTLDKSGSLLTVPSQMNSDNVLVTYDPNGNVRYTTTVPQSSIPSAYAGLVSSSDMWLISDSFISYTTVGSTGAPTTANVLPSAPIGSWSLIYAQYVFGKLYWGDSTSNNLYYMNPAVKVGTGTKTLLVNSMTKFYFQNPGTLYGYTASTLNKYTVTNGISILAYSTSVSYTPTYVTSMVVNGTTYVLFMSTSGAAYSIIRYTDTGSTFSDETVIVTTDTFVIRSVTPSPKATCSDTLKDQDETDVDCGGSACPKCVDGKSCLLNRDCRNSYCNSNLVCATPACDDLAKNQDETDVDCGGAKCSKCADSKGCKLDADCLSGYCNTNTLTCAAPTCDDGAKNQDETDIDCGGAVCSKCADNKVCNGDSDCVSGVCITSVCAAPTCVDTVMNGDETDLDCGGGGVNSCTGCAIDQKCSVDSDCLGDKCVGNLCAESCKDNILNQNETDIDCGGSNCGSCADDKTCLNNGDCISNFCTPDSNVCKTPTCLDTYLNQDETDVDCGGPNCGGCADEKTCSVNGDCLSNFCNPDSNVCKTPTCLDTYQNQDETDIDCGGSNCSKCAVGKKCDMNSDCETNTCANNFCANPPVAPPQPIDTPVDGPQSVESPTGSQAPASSSPVSSTPIKQKLVSASSVTETSVLGLLSLVIIFA